MSVRTRYGECSDGFFGPRRPPTRRERLVLALGAIAGAVLIAVSGMHGWWNAVGVGLVGGCGGGLMWSRGFRGASARSEGKPPSVR